MANVSVVIPCYNGARFLRETLESAVAQTHSPLEILVIDDGSTDDSAAIAESFGPPVRVIRQSNQGESVARNRGIEEAKGNWVAFLDADDLWLPNKLERCVSNISPDIDWLCTFHYSIRFERELVLGRNLTKERFSIIRDSNFSIPIIMREGAPCLIQTVMVRTGLPIRFPTWTKYGEDTIYFLELSRSYRHMIISEPLTIYRLHNTNQSGRLDIDCLWHASMSEWLRRNTLLISAQSLNLYALENDRRLLFAAMGARMDDNILRYRSIQSYCDSLPRFSFRRELLSVGSRSRLFYKCQRFYSALRRRFYHPKPKDLQSQTRPCYES